MNIFGPVNSGAAAGGAGSATANADSTVRLSGYLVGVYVKYNDAPPAGTTDVVIKTKGTAPSAPSFTFLTLTNAATDGWFFPRMDTHTVAGAVITDGQDWPALDDFVNVSIAQANAADNIDVWFLID
jgi:hypothetical protein